MSKKKARLLLASTGTGKTFMSGGLVRRLVDMKFTEDKTFGPTEYLYVTRATIVEQTKRVFENQFKLSPKDGVEILNIEQLRSRAGSMWVTEKTIIVNGEEQQIWVWRKGINPPVILWDECQALKNDSSSQHRIAASLNNLDTELYQVFISATPFTRVSEAKCFACACGHNIEHLGFPKGTILSNETWPTYASIIASPSSPDEYNEAAVERLTKDLEAYIVRVKGVRPQFEAENKVEIVDFQPPEQTNGYDTRKEYNTAWGAYITKMAELEKDVTDNPRMQIMIQQGILLGAAENCKRYLFAERLHNSVKNGKAAVLGVKRKKTIISVVKILVEKYGVSRDQISIIWGGGQTQLTERQKLKASIKAKGDKLREANMSEEEILEALDLKDVEDRVLEDLPESLRLGMQSKEERQSEIDKFQSGRSLYAIFTEASGGVGLSLHHTDELTKQWNTRHPLYEEWYKKICAYNDRQKEEKKKVKPGKVRRQENGYAILEDIPFIITRQRETIFGPTWSPIAMIQKIGRVPRLTSLSNSPQTFLYHKGTIEAEQAMVLTHRLRCAGKVVRQHENWMDLIENYTKTELLVKEKIKEIDSMPDTAEDVIEMDD